MLMSRPHVVLIRNEREVCRKEIHELVERQRREIDRLAEPHLAENPGR